MRPKPPVSGNPQSVSLVLTADSPAKASIYNSVPAALISANQSVIMSTVSYTYTGSLNMVIKTVPTITKTFYMRPRKVAKIDCPTC